MESTTSRAPVTVCIIARNEEKNIENCLMSVRQWVDEIVLVDTGSTDNTAAIAKKYVDKYEYYVGCNNTDTGIIEDFSNARTKSYSLAKNKFVLWLDSDDILVGGEHLARLVQLYENSKDKNICVLLPYEYAHDENGNVTVLHYRERLVYPAENFKWHNPVHEVLIGPDDTQQNVCDNIKVVHQRGSYGKVSDPYRNFNILRSYVDKIGDTDPRQLYYLGLEYGNIGEIENSINMLKRYTELSGWDDEKCLAMITIAKHYLERKDYENSIFWATKSLTVKEMWCESYLHLAKTYYGFAQSLEEKGEPAYKYWEKCANFCKIGLALPVTKTLLFVNPYERNVDIHRYYNYALNKTNDLIGALESVEEALKHKPNDPIFLSNREIYMKEISRRIIETEAEKLKSTMQITDEGKQIISDVLNNKPMSFGGNLRWPDYHRPEGYPRNVTGDSFPKAVISPHAQAWGIPETFVYDDLPVRTSNEQLKSVIGLLWKELMLHDEVQTALYLLRNAPYRIRHTDFVERLLQSTLNTIEWSNDENTYDLGNSAIEMDGSILRKEMVPLPQLLQGAAAMRFAWISDRMTDKSKRILDFGCIDGEFTNRWGLAGYDVTGLDICSNSIEIANAKSAEFKLNTRHIRTFFQDAPDKLRDQKFDYITCADTYEHIMDRVENLLKPARKLAKDDARLFLVCPFGSWFQGHWIKSGHPWLWSEQGEHWLSEKPRAHVIAPTVWNVVDELREAGWYVKNCSVYNQWYPDVPGQGNVCAEALAEHPSSVGLDIVVYLGDAPEVWDPNSVNITGIGGSEMAAIQMCKRLASMGNRVRVYSSCGERGEGVYDGVEYRITEKYHDLKCDVLIVSREGGALEDKHNIQAKTRLLWTHDVYPKSFNRELALKTDKILALSNWHKNHILEKCPYVHPDQIIVTQNGIDISRFEQPTSRNPHKVVCSSSPDRYLPALLKMWPKIRNRVPDAELHVFYGFKNWEYAADVSKDEGQKNLINELKSQMNQLASSGVMFRDRMPQQDLAKEFMSAGVWAYPTWYSETSCISAMEAQAAGLHMVTSPIAALNETASDRATMIHGDWLSDSYSEAFVNATVEAMKNTSEEKRASLMNYACQNFNWDSVAKEWDSMMKKMVSQAEYGTLEFQYQGSSEAAE